MVNIAEELKIFLPPTSCFAKQEKLKLQNDFSDLEKLNFERIELCNCVASEHGYRDLDGLAVV